MKKGATVRVVGPSFTRGQRHTLWIMNSDEQESTKEIHRHDNPDHTLWVGRKDIEEATILDIIALLVDKNPQIK